MWPSRLVSALAMTVYLAAAFLPCEPPDGAVWQAGGGHAAQDARESHDERPHQAAVSSHAQMSHAAHAGQTGHAGHAAHGRGDADSGFEASARKTARLALSAICPCGCSETRSGVGGGTARLGSVVPGLAVARLLEAPRHELVARVPEPADEVFFAIDPIPI